MNKQQHNMKNKSICIALLMLCTFALTQVVFAGNSDIYQAQKILTQLGYDPGPVDGHSGVKTHAALKQYQKDNKLSQTGKLDNKTAKALGIKMHKSTKNNSDPRLSTQWGMVAPEGCYWQCNKSSGCSMGHATASNGMQMLTDTNQSHKNPGWIRKCE